MDKPKILVTGGLGFIGSHTVVELQQAGYDVVIVDDLSNSHHSVLERIGRITGIRPAFYPVNMVNQKDLAEVMYRSGRIHAVIHFAAFKAVGESVRQPLKYFYNNLISLISLLQCMEAAAITNIVFSSSATVYGDPEHLPVTETAPVKKALSAYGSTKQMGEEILEKTAVATALRVIGLRYFNPAGAHPSSLIGELPLGVPNNLVPFITQTAAGIRDQLTVFGNDYSTPDGTCLRDYIHVVDLAKAHVNSCTALLRGQAEAFEIYNIGTGNPFSVMEMIRAFETYNQVRLSYQYGPRRNGDTASLYADVQKATDRLSWKAELGLEEIVTTAWNWQKTLN